MRTFGEPDHRGTATKDEKVYIEWKQVMLRIPPRHHRRYKVMAAKLGVSMGSMMVDMLDYAYARWKTVTILEENLPGEMPPELER